MEFTGFCYSNSRVSSSCFGEMFVGWVVKGTYAFLEKMGVFMPVLSPGPVRSSFNADRASVNPWAESGVKISLDWCYGWGSQ